MATPSFDDVVKNLRTHFNNGEKPQLLAVLMDDARRMAADCPCARCTQNLDLLERAFAVLSEIIPADRN